VPSASWCRTCVLRRLEVASATVNSGRTVVALGDDRVGTSAIVARLTAGHGPRGAAETTSERPGVRRYHWTSVPAGGYASTQARHTEHPP
jgi:hypothetical protein